MGIHGSASNTDEDITQHEYVHIANEDGDDSGKCLIEPLFRVEEERG